MIKTFQRIWELSEKRHKNFICALILSLLRSIVGITQLIAILLAVKTIVGDIDFYSGMIEIAILTGICIIGNFCTSYFEQIHTLKCGFYMIADQRVCIANHLRKLPLGYFDEASSGKICTSLTTTLSNVETAATMVMISVVSGLFSTFSLFLFMLFYDWKIAIVTGVGMICYLIIINYQMKLSRKYAPMLQKTQNHLSATTFSFLQGIKVIKSFSFENGNKEMKDAIVKSCDANVDLTAKSMPSQFIANICIAIFESIILLLSIYLCFTDGTIDYIKLFVLLMYSFMVYASFNQAGSMLSMIGLLDSSLSEIEEIKNEEQMKQEYPNQKAVSNQIVLEQVCFAYGENEVLHDISLTIQPNTLTALIGPSGSGKTTLCELIPRFRDVSKGKITIGGADLRFMKEEELMKKISMVFQQVYLFEDTILNNIRFAKPNATLEEVRRAAKAAYCDNFIMALPDGYNTLIKEGGNTLSGGEKQRISIARAILKDAPIVLLDEATSALDAENEHEILAAIQQLTKNKTVLMIAHRIATVQKADCILVLKNGRIIQKGTHKELENKPGLYKDFLLSRKKAREWKMYI